jgi:hypothetical protein
MRLSLDITKEQLQRFKVVAALERAEHERLCVPAYFPKRRRGKKAKPYSGLRFSWNQD